MLQSKKAEYMPNLKRLLQGQNIQFDTHQAGDGQAVNLEHLHLEKILHGKGGKIRFPMAGGFEPNWSKGVSEDKYDSVCKEVQRELRKNINRTNELAETVVDVFRRYSSGKVSTETLKKAANKLAHYFGLDEHFVRTVEEYADNQIISFTSFHINTESHFLQEIKLFPDRIIIKKSRSKNRNL